MKEPVKHKLDMYKRWIAGEFGNRLQCWESYDEYLESGFKGRIGLRYKEPGSPFCKYDIERENVGLEYLNMISRGAQPELITLGEAAPDQHITMQGEIIQSARSYELHYSLYKAQMRIALDKEPRWAYGVRALLIMQYFMDAQSLSDIQEMLENYPDHCIEFSCYSINLGNCPNRNTLIWEVRYY